MTKIRWRRVGRQGRDVEYLSLGGMRIMGCSERGGYLVYRMDDAGRWKLWLPEEPGKRFKTLKEAKCAAADPRSSAPWASQTISQMTREAMADIRELAAEATEGAHVSVNACRWSVDMIVSEPGKPMRLLQLSWEEIRQLVFSHGATVEREQIDTLLDDSGPGPNAKLPHLDHVGPRDAGSPVTRTYEEISDD